MKRRIRLTLLAILVGAQILLGSYLFFYETVESIEWAGVNITQVSRPLRGVLIIHTIDGQINSSETGRVIEYANLVKASELIINLSSPGGRIFDAIEIADRIYKSNVPVTTRTRSVAASAAFYVFLAGHKRVISANAFLMHHSMQVPPMVTLTESQRKFIQTLQRRFNDFVKSVACGTDDEETELFDISFGSDKEVWLDGRRAKSLCLATDLEE